MGKRLLAAFLALVMMTSPTLTAFADRDRAERRTRRAHYRVTFDSNGGGSVVPQTVRHGGQLRHVKDPVRSGYVFAGWQYNGSLVNLKHLRVTKNITLKAKWTPSAAKPSPTPTPKPTPKPSPTPTPKPSPTPTPTPKPTPSTSSVSPSATVEKLNGNRNMLTITITRKSADGSQREIARKTFSIKNNAADVYEVGDYNVYVDTKGNTQIRACYILR